MTTDCMNPECFEERVRGLERDDQLTAAREGVVVLLDYIRHGTVLERETWEAIGSIVVADDLDDLGRARVRFARARADVNDARDLPWRTGTLVTLGLTEAQAARREAELARERRMAGPDRLAA